MNRYQLLISYEGTAYCGWQIQTSGRSIQGEIERALQIFFKHPCRLIAAGRTDAGVHAQGQVAHFDTDVAFESRRLLHSLSGLLPLDIRVLSVQPVSLSFHAQYSAQRKIYSYRIWQEAIVDPFVRHFVCHDMRPFCESTLKQVLTHFEGTHDFAAFVNQGTPVSSTERTIYRAQWIPVSGGFSIEFEGNGFLYKMVRNLMGTLLDISCGKKDLSILPSIFASKDRRVASAAAPACGLCLKQVLY